MRTKAPEPHGALKSALTGLIVADLPGMVVAEPAAVDAAIGVIADLLGAAFGLARMALDADAYSSLVVTTMVRADRVARERGDAAITATAAGRRDQGAGMTEGARIGDGRNARAEGMVGGFEGDCSAMQCGANPSPTGLGVKVRRPTAGANRRDSRRVGTAIPVGSAARGQAGEAAAVPGKCPEAPPMDVSPRVGAVGEQRQPFVRADVRAARGRA